MRSSSLSATPQSGFGLDDLPTDLYKATKRAMGSHMLRKWYNTNLYPFWIQNFRQKKSCIQNRYRKRAKKYTAEAVRILLVVDLFLVFELEADKEADAADSQDNDCT